MNSGYSWRFRLAVLVVVTPALVLLIFSVLTDQSYHTFRYLGNAMLILLGLLSLVGGVIDMRKGRREGDTIRWYQHSYVRFGMFLLSIVLVYLFYFFFLRVS